ncbi:MAG: hypothetical protein LC637_14455 [Xanthomonadaceae bacterium]|nr:hypothetical protein [Xanthomonadaceae bacterium]
MKLQMLTIFLSSLLVVGLAACGKPAEPEPTLEERAVVRWQHLIDRDFQAAWEYYSPGFRQTTPQADFARDMERRPIRWHSVELLSLECEEDVCRVDLQINYQPVGAPGAQSQMRLDREIEEQWIRLDGQWWYSSS